LKSYRDSNRPLMPPNLVNVLIELGPGFEVRLIVTYKSLIVNQAEMYHWDFTGMNDLSPLKYNAAKHSSLRDQGWLVTSVKELVG
jgi:hypothetical protein